MYSQKLQTVFEHNKQIEQLQCKIANIPEAKAQKICEKLEEFKVKGKLFLCW